MDIIRDVLLGALLLLSIAQVSPQAALQRAVSELGAGRASEAVDILDEALAQQPAPELAAKLHRQRGIALLSIRPRSAVMSAFVRALDADPKITLPDELPAIYTTLFDCAVTVRKNRVPDEVVRSSYAAGLAKGAGVPAFGAGEDRRESGGELVAEKTPPAAIEEDTIWSSPWVWVIGGVLVAGGAVAVGVAASGEREPYGGSTDTILRP